jgi:predicted DNA-binding transcriptional regulator YafY
LRKTAVPRADRLFALVQLLSGSSRKALHELSTELGTSPRSIYRDLADLEARGLAIERSEGGYRLLDRSVLRATPLSARERLLLTLVLENRGIESQPLFRAALATLRSKLGNMKHDTWALSGPDRSGAAPESVTASLEQAIERSHSVSLLYASLSSGRRGWRGVDPWILLHRSEA